MPLVVGGMIDLLIYTLIIDYPRYKTFGAAQLDKEIAFAEAVGWAAALISVGGGGDPLGGGPIKAF